MLFIVTPVSNGVGTALLGIIAGFAIVLVIRLGALLYFRNAFFTNFFRTNVVGANFFFLVSWNCGGWGVLIYLYLLTNTYSCLQILEAWNVALAVGFITVRIIKLILVSVFFIARIDTP